jgi:hypothetical protein
MFDFKNVEAAQRLNKDFILSKISDSMIFGYYHGSFKIGDVYPCKFRKDTRPSAGFYVSTSGKIIYNDMGRNNEKFDAFAFVQRLYNCDFSTAIKRIASDFGLVNGQQTASARKVMKDMANFEKKMRTETKIHFEADKWTSENLAFWKEYHITKQELKENHIYPIRKLYLNETFLPNRNDDLRFALCIPVKDELKTKVYAPGSQDLKWVSNIPNTLPFGLDTLKFKGQKCFVAKAQKDRLIIKKFLPDVIASQNESASAISPKVLRILNFNYETNFVGWDNDWPGLRGMVQMRRLEFVPLYVPVKMRIEEGIKDFSDLAKAKGLKAVEKLLKQYNVI